VEPITLALLFLFGGAAVGISMGAVQNWIDANKIPNGTAEMVRNKLAGGKFQVVAGIFDQSGELITTKTWSGDRLDSALEARFNREGDIIHVVT